MPLDEARRVLDLCNVCKYCNGFCEVFRAAERLEIQNATARDELLPAADVRHAWGDIIRDVRAGLLAVPSRCGAALPHLSVADVESIDGEIRAALEGLADDAD